MTIRVKTAIHMKQSEPPIVVACTYPNSVERVWDSITIHAEMIQWFFEDIPAFEPVVGFATSFPVSTGERTFTHQWEILEVIPQRKIKYSWNYPEYPGDSTVSFELEALDGSTNLKVICEVLEDYPDDISEFKRESGVAGWTYFLKERLRAYLEGEL